MTKMFTPHIPAHLGSILCGYLNRTSRVQVVRIADIPNWYFERVVFPGQCLLFHAPPQAHLEIYTSAMPSALLADKLPCDRLQVSEDTSLPEAV